MFLKHPEIRNLRILRIFSKSIEIKYFYGPHSNKVHYILVIKLYSIMYHFQASRKPRSEQECKEAHEPYALHKKIRSEDCPYSTEILAMERKFERYCLKFSI